MVKEDTSSCLVLFKLSSLSSAIRTMRPGPQDQERLEEWSLSLPLTLHPTPFPEVQGERFRLDPNTSNGLDPSCFELQSTACVVVHQDPRPGSWGFVGR